jgi:hypothetical protein
MFNKNQMNEKVQQLLTSFNRAIVIVAAFVIGIGAHFSYGVYKEYRNNTAVLPTTRSLSHTSVAVNERGEFLLIDRETGRYSIYSKEVGDAVFNTYAKQMYTNINSK